MNTRLFIAEGLVITREGNTLEFDRRHGTTIQFADVATGLVTALEESEFFDELQTGRLTVLPESFSSKTELILPESQVRPSIHDLNELKSKKYKTRVLRRQDYVRAIQKEGITRGQLDLIADAIPRVAAALNDNSPPAAITIATWMRKFEQAHMSIYVLVDKRALKDKRQRRSEEHDELILDQYQNYWFRGNPLPIPEIYGKYVQALKFHNQNLAALGRPQENAISERTFYRVEKTFDRYDVMVAQLGREQARHAYRFLKGHLPAKRPLDFVEIDHALLDIFVIDDKLFLPLGRPWVTVLRDRRSGAVIGLYVSFASSGVDSIFAAMRHSIYPHDRVAACWPDIENVLPHGLAEVYVLDRGGDFLAQRLRLGIRQIGSDYEYCEARTPWHKAVVERFFLTLAELLETMPGKTFSSLEKRKDYDSAKHSVCRFSTFVWILYKWAADYHNARRSRTKLAKPLDLFYDGIASFPPAYPRDPHAIETILGVSHQSSLRHEGILFKGLNYVGDELEQVYRHRGKDNKSKLVWHVNNANLGVIRVLDPRSQAFFVAPCSRPDYADGLSLYQHNYLRRIARQHIKKAGQVGVDELIRVQDAIREKIGEEILAKETAGKKRLARLAGISSESVLSGQKRSIAEPFGDKSQPPNEPADTVDAKLERTFVDVPSFGWGVN